MTATELTKKEHNCPNCQFSDNGKPCENKRCWWTMKRQELEEFELITFGEVIS